MHDTGIKEPPMHQVHCQSTAAWLYCSQQKAVTRWEPPIAPFGQVRCSDEQQRQQTASIIFISLQQTSFADSEGSLLQWHSVPYTHPPTHALIWRYEEQQSTAATPLCWLTVQSRSHFWLCIKNVEIFSIFTTIACGNFVFEMSNLLGQDGVVKTVLVYFEMIWMI